MSDIAVTATPAEPDLRAPHPPPPDPGPWWSVALRLLAGMLAVTLTMLAVGFALTRLGLFEGLRGWDAQAARWWFEHRNPTAGELSQYATFLADTNTAIVVAAVSVVALRLWLGRWYESGVLLVSILGELVFFLALTSLVGRHRPDVEHLDLAPPTSSFPSGHTGVSVALYGALAYLLWRYGRHWFTHLALPIVLLLVPVVVATSRMYRGMHYPTDVLGGALGGGLWLAVVIWVLMPRTSTSPDQPHEPERIEVSA